jgi:hypothetical protein
MNQKPGLGSAPPKKKLLSLPKHIETFRRSLIGNSGAVNNKYCFQ